MKDSFKKIDSWESKLKPCPFCGSTAEMWEYKAGGDIYQKVTMCSNAGDGSAGDECPMYLPPRGFYKSTKREAMEIWNTRHTQ